MKRIIVIGGGPAGIMAAIVAARNNHQVTLLEKNEKLGKKLFITGKGRCNLTNASDVENLLKNMVSNPKFLYSSFYGFDSYQLMDFFETLGLTLKVERGNRVFPLSDRSSDVIKALERELKRLGVEVRLNTNVNQILEDNRQVIGVKVGSNALMADNVIVATGGISYPNTGSTGDGYKFAKSLGHQVTSLYPALVPVVIKEEWCKSLQGLSLKNVSARFMKDKKVLFEDFGEMIFTHYGVSGPIILSGSCFISQWLKEKTLKLVLDLKPALTVEQLDARIVKDFQGVMNKQFQNSLQHLLPSKLIPIIIELSGINPYKKVNEVSKEERSTLVQLLKNLPMTIEGLRGYNEAIITKGGVSTKEINPSTMESKLIQGLFFAGEVLDLCGLTGGYNLQIAWSNAYLAGISI